MQARTSARPLLPRLPRSCRSTGSHPPTPTVRCAPPHLPSLERLKLPRPAPSTTPPALQLLLPARQPRSHRQHSHARQHHCACFHSPALPAAPPAPGTQLSHATSAAALALARPASPPTPLYLLSRPRPAALALACSCSRESACAASLTLRGPSSTPRLPALPHSRQPLPPAPSRRPWDHRQAPAGLLEEYLVGLFSTNSSSRQRQAGLCQRQSHPQARTRGHEVQSLP